MEAVSSAHVSDLSIAVMALLCVLGIIIPIVLHALVGAMAVVATAYGVVPVAVEVILTGVAVVMVLIAKSVRARNTGPRAWADISQTTECES